MRNQVTIEGAVAKIHIGGRNSPLSFAMVDTADLEIVSQIPGTWSRRASGYIYYAARGVHMHRLLMGQPPTSSHVVDHINHDPADNRRSCNLRWLTQSENVRHVREDKRIANNWKAVRA